MADKATIVLFSHVSNTRSITGAEKLLLFFGRELSLYFNCLLVAPHEGKLTRQARKHGLEVQLLPIPLLYGMYTPYAGLEADARSLQESKEFTELTQWLWNLKPTFIITSTCVHVLPAMAAKFLGIPVVWKISERITDNDYTPISVDLIHRYSDEILAISHTVAAPFPEEIRQAKVTLLPPSWNDAEMMTEAWSKLRGERRRELRIAPDKPLIGYISSFINKEKGLEHFVNMAVLVSSRYPSSHFLVVGMPGDKSFYDRCVRKVKLEGLTSLFRFVDYEECIPAAYCALDVLVVPSLIREGFGMTALEGLAFGKPVVSYNSGGLGEILHTAGCADYLVTAEDIDALAEVVCTLLAEPGLAEILGNQARERVNAIYGPAAYHARLQGLAEVWNLRYCLPSAERYAAALTVPPAADAPGVPGPEPQPGPEAAEAPRRNGRKRRARLRRGKLRRGKLRRAKSRARRRTRPAVKPRRAGRKRRGGSARRRTAGQRKGKRRSARRSSRRKTA
ncbi:glycosyltransferase family 4 protein [Paenibacillus wynnii]|uniref:glycosyltransferase family 4 protein n=1 Tax=Paenibacillus wynnii TaxID=268407 RepID=UPI002793F695|nr:glycosyltransferase family 4 protein [Paenibacillus wynnii]MDQ0194544.1 glycosyltransferase involved in cell wall biosynthesis [Paenibacillus wynnii]